MNGKAPTTSTVIIVRTFRGHDLCLASYDPHGGFHWTRDRDAALRLDRASALTIADKAAREYGAACATLAADGTMAQPKSAVKAPVVEFAAHAKEIRTKARKQLQALQRSFTAQAREDAHCDNHVAFDSDCIYCTGAMLAERAS